MEFSDVSSAHNVYPLANATSLVTLRRRRQFPTDGVPLYVSPEEYTHAREAGAWPARSPSLIFDPNQKKWLISEDHSQFEELVERYGENNEHAVSNWQAAADREAAVYAALNTANVLPMNQRCYLDGIDTDVAGKVGATFDRINDRWFIDASRPDAEELAKIYNGEKARERDEQRAEARDSGYMDKVGGGAALAAGGVALAAGVTAARDAVTQIPSDIYVEGAVTALQNYQRSATSFSEAMNHTETGLDQIQLAATHVTKEVNTAFDGLLAAAKETGEVAAAVLEPISSEFGKAATKAAGGIASQVAGHAAITSASLKALMAAVPPPVWSSMTMTAGVVAGLGVKVAYDAWKQRREAREVAAKVAPWTLETGTFGQVAKSLYAFERSKTQAGKHRAVVRDKISGDTMFSISSDNRIPARTVIRSMHGALVGQAVDAGMGVSQKVLDGVAAETRRAGIETNLRVGPHALVATAYVDPNGGAAAARQAADDLDRRGVNLDLATVKTATQVAMANADDDKERQGLGLGIKLTDAKIAERVHHRARSPKRRNQRDMER